MGEFYFLTEVAPGDSGMIEAPQSAQLIFMEYFT